MRVVHSIEGAHVDGLLALYAAAWWARARRRDDVVRMLAGSAAVVGLVDDAGRLVAFARAITDGVFRAVVYDVIVDPGLHGRALGRQVMDALLAHPRLAGVESVALYCLPDLVPFYERLGFTDDVHDLRLMLRGGAGGAP